MKNNPTFIESDLIRLFGMISPVSVTAYIQMLRNDLEKQVTLRSENEKFMYETIRKIILGKVAAAQDLLVSIYANKNKESEIVADDIKKELGASYSKVFQVPYDWITIMNNRELNAECFFKLYTMQK